MFTKVLIADPIVLNNRDTSIYKSARTPKEIVEGMGGVFLNGEIPADAKYPDDAIVFSYQPNLKPAEIDKELDKGYTGVIVAAKAVTNTKAKYAVRIGAGTNNVQAIADAGGVVMNTPGFNSKPTAEAIVYALNQALTLKTVAEPNGQNPTDLYAQTRDVIARGGRADSDDLSPYYHGGWPEFKGEKPSPKKVAIIGAGHIGGLAAEKLQADGHEVVTYSRSNTKQAQTPLEAATGADVIIVQTPLNDQTRGIISEEVIRAANKGVVIVNAARAEVVNVKALEKAVMDNHVGGIIADLDYFPDRPSPMGPYRELVREAMVEAKIDFSSPKIILTPHTFADTHSPSRQAGAMQAVHQMMHALTKNPEVVYINHVNRGDKVTLVQDGLKPETLDPRIAAAISGSDLSAVRNAANSKQIQK